jgi:uncharacterized membrane protein (UPF0127 family)
VTWLLRDGDVLAAAEVASTLGQRSKGLMGRDEYQGALICPGARSAHTVGMRFAIDVAFCDQEMVVVGVTTLPPWRLAMPRRGTRSLIKAEAGAFERWGLHTGDHLEVRG